MSVNDVRKYAKLCKIYIADLPEAEAEVPRQRPNRAARRAEASSSAGDGARPATKRKAPAKDAENDQPPSKKSKNGTAPPVETTADNPETAADDEKDEEEDDDMDQEPVDLESWLIERLGDMAHYDNHHVGDDTQRDRNGILVPRTEWSSQLDFLTALDDVRACPAALLVGMCIF